MGFENIRLRYENRENEPAFSPSSQSQESSSSFVKEIFSLIALAFLGIAVFIVETVKLILEIVGELFDDPGRFLKHSYLGGGFFHALLFFSPKIENLFLHFSMGELFNLLFKIVFLSVLWFIFFIKITQIPWIVFVVAVLIAYYIQKRDYDTLPTIFWIWCVITTFIYIFFFIKFM